MKPPRTLQKQVFLQIVGTIPVNFKLWLLHIGMHHHPHLGPNKQRIPAGIWTICIHLDPLKSSHLDLLFAFLPMALHLWIPSGRSDSVSDFRTISRSGRPRPPFCGDVCHGRTSSKTKIFMMLMKDDERIIIPNPAQIYLFLFKYTWDSFWITQASNEVADIHHPQPTSPLRSWGSHGIASPSGDGRIMF